MRTLITCMGECLIDFLPLQKGEETVEFRMHPAGSLLNVAVSVARLGQPAAFAGKIAKETLKQRRGGKEKPYQFIQFTTNLKFQAIGIPGVVALAWFSLLLYVLILD